MLIAQRPVLSEETVADNRSRFVIEPLEPGFGYTLGNSMRRTLLSSIPGASVTSIRVDGVLHEFSTVPGVKEDVTEIILNTCARPVPAPSPPRTSRRRPASRSTTPICTWPRSTPRAASRWS